MCMVHAVGARCAERSGGGRRHADRAWPERSCTALPGLAAGLGLGDIQPDFQYPGGHTGTGGSLHQRSARRLPAADEAVHACNCPWNPSFCHPTFASKSSKVAHLRLRCREAEPSLTLSAICVLAVLRARGQCTLVSVLRRDAMLECERVHRS